MIKGIIYKYTSPSGKSYIGKTINPKKRANGHKNKTPHLHTKFGNAINKYGFENFVYEEIMTIPSTSEERLNIILSIMEKYFIKKYNTISNGYNITEGGEGISGYHHTSSTKEMLGKLSSSRILSATTKNKIFLGNWKTKNGVNDDIEDVKIEQLSPNGELVNIWSNGMEIQRNLGILTGEVHRCCKGKYKTYKGFVWRYRIERKEVNHA